MTTAGAPPTALKRPVTLTSHGDDRVDEWYWLRERDNPEVIAYLEAENAYTTEMLASTEPLRKTLYDEIVARIQETDISVPVRNKGWWYYTRSVEGSQYPVHCRQMAKVEGYQLPPVIDAGPPGVDDAVLLDENEAAEGHDFFELGAFEISPDHSLLGWATDTTGGEVYTLRFREVATGADLDDAIQGTYYGLAWAADNRTVFYTRPNAAMRPFQVWRHVLGTPPSADVLVLQEDDERFYVGIAKTKDDAFVLLEMASKITTETRYISSADPLSEPTVIASREEGVEYEVEHRDGAWLILTNADGAENFKVMTAPVGAGREAWTPLVPYDQEVRTQSVEVFAKHLVLHQRAGGMLRIAVVGNDRFDVLAHPEPVHAVWIGANPEYESQTLRFLYTSMITPMSVFDYDMESGERTLLKQEPVLGGYDASRYRTERVWATAADGVTVPISLVYDAAVPRDGSAPCLLYGYGSYESSTEPRFSHFRLSLLERGFVFALAHVRGGGEMGRRWYEDGKFLTKTNTFHDFIAAATHLVSSGWTAPERLVIRGGSAGGLLMGAVVNLRPDLFRAVVAEVPFVDCLTTILDGSLPLTAIEWEEWGNPVEDAAIYAYMKAYSPYDCVAAQAYPRMLVTAGLNDPRVSYWEPAKWVARLRDRKTDSNVILLKTEMGAGHMGPSGRYDAWREEALVLGFIISAVEG